MELLGSDLLEILFNVTLITGLSELASVRVRVAVFTVLTQSDKLGLGQCLNSVGRQVALCAGKILVFSL